MKWSSLGVIQISDVWQAFPLLAVEATTFRLIHSLTLTPTDPAHTCYLAQRFNLEIGEGQSPWRRIYPSETPQIIQLPIPEDFQSAGIVGRAIEVKRRYPFYGAKPWHIELQFFDSEE